MRPMNTNKPQRVFIPIDAGDHPALLPSDRLVAYQPGFVLFSQLDPAPPGKAKAARTATTGDRPA